VPRPDEAPLVYWNRGYRQLCAAEAAEPPLARALEVRPAALTFLDRPRALLEDPRCQSRILGT
jgi:hypothetical protein